MTIIIPHMIQGSEEWKKARIGCVTMSRAKDLITGGEGKTRFSYLLEVVSEMESGKPANRIKTYDMERGILLEPYARRAYEARTGRKVKEIGIGYLDDMRRIAASPDGLSLSQDRGAEFKCPNPKAHARSISSGIPTEYMPQVQGCMWIFDKPEWDFASFCPQYKRMPLYITTVKRDDAMIKQISDQAHLAIEEIDSMVSQPAPKITADVRDICEQAIYATDELYGNAVEIY
jgi:hypothetical protein